MNWPESLVYDLACRRVVLFFGAGTSMASTGRDGKTKPKTWKQFLLDATKKVGKPNSLIFKNVTSLIEKNDFLTACDVIKREIKRDNFVELMRQEFLEPGYQAAQIHEKIWSLDLRVTITPNFDSIYDTLATTRSNGTVLIKSYLDDDVADCIRGKARVLIKSHGTINKPDDLIFTRVDYAKARNDHRDFYDLITSLLNTHTFLFIGCGVDDPDIRLLLENYCYKHKNSRSHYFAIPEKRLLSEVSAVLEESLRLKFVTYKSKDQDHSRLVEGLEELRVAVEQQRIEIGRTMSW